jgi:hypothetical protein
MNNNDPAFMANSQGNRKKQLIADIKGVVASQSLENQRRLMASIASELDLPLQDCAAALLYLNEVNGAYSQVVGSRKSPADKALSNPAQRSIKLVRYRLDLGHQHQITLDELKKVLVEESGVDINNIANVRIQDLYTLIDLPDEMPQEIFHHLKTVEINERMLDIRRVKPRNKKRGNRRHRHVRHANLQSSQESN